jgi:hypothetical protein
LFYRLIAIDGCAIPAPMVLEDIEYRVDRGGLLLEPPRGSVDMSSDGYGILQFFGSHNGNSVEHIASSREAYRWRAPEVLDFSRPNSVLGARLSGIVTADRLELVAEAGDAFVRPGTRLDLVADPASPIADDWQRTFDFGPPEMQPVDAALRDDPVVMNRIRELILAGEPRRRRAAAARLEAAWRAPA